MQVRDKIRTTLNRFYQELNFFRVHLIFFLVGPLIFSAIIYAANGSNHISYVDCLFNSVSAICVCGLATVDLSGMTAFQQVLLFIQSAVGTPIVASWVMVLIRRQYFYNHLQSIVESEVARRKELDEEQNTRPPWRRALSRSFTRQNSRKVTGHENHSTAIGPEMIRRRNTEPKRIDPAGQVVEEPHSMESARSGNMADESRTTVGYDADGDPSKKNSDTLRPILGPDNGRPSVTFDIADEELHDDRLYVPPGMQPRLLRRSTTVYSSRSKDATDTTNMSSNTDPRHTGFGGFPYPTVLLNKFLGKLAPSWTKPTRTMSITRSRTIEVGEKHGHMDLGETLTYFSDTFNAMVGRNSKFYSLTNEHLEELGGVEFRALNALLWILPIYHFGIQLICFAVIAPYMSISRWKDDFQPPNLKNPVNPIWYSLFQVNSVYTTTGMSLVDQSMVPFREAYPLVFLSTILVLAGNLAFPIFFRSFIWFIMSLVPDTQLQQSLRFLLDHPRRCFILLFPKAQTYILLIVVCALNAVDWLAFETLSLGIPDFDAIPAGVRAAVGLLQGECVRVAGLTLVSLSSLAPSIQVFYIVMMYLGVYPIALSVRATNVYEEKSLGVYEEEEEEEEPEVNSAQPAVLSRYLSWHARRQLAFDMWWLGFALFLVCIIERHKILDDNNFSWFTIYTVLFEIISAYAGVGLSFGVANDNFSLSGAFSTTSKLIVCAVIIRGRHRALPVAVDRAIMLPHEFKKVEPVERQRTVDNSGISSGITNEKPGGNSQRRAGTL